MTYSNYKRYLQLMKQVVLIVILSICSMTAKSQNYEGTEFYFAYMANLQEGINTPPIFEVSVHATATLTASLEYGQLGDPYYFNIQQEIEADEVGIFTLEFGQYLNQQVFNQVETRSFRVTTTAPARVYAFHNRSFFAEASAVLPTTSLSKNHFITSVEPTNVTSLTMFSILGVADSTEVFVVPKANTAFGLADQQFGLTLNKGEVITISSEQDLTGSQVFSEGQDFALFEGINFSQIPVQCGATSHVWEQTLPVEYWSQLYPILPVEGNDGDLFRIVAAEDFTEVYLDCQLLTELNKGDFFETFLTSPEVLTATKPVSVVSFLVGTSCAGLDSGDPNMRRILPLDKGNTKVKIETNYALQNFGPPFNGPRFSFLHVIIPTDQTNGVNVNGSPIDGWEPFDNLPAMAYARIEVPELDSLLVVDSPNPFWAERISMGDFDAMSLSLGANADIVIPDGAINIAALGPDQTICPGETLVIENFSNGFWQDGSFQNSFEVDEPGTYTISVEDACGSGFDEVTVSEGFEPNLNVPSEITVCPNIADSLVIETEPGVTYSWSTGATGNVLSLSEIGFYTVTAVSSDGCASEAQVEAISADQAELEISGPDFICDGDSVVLTVSADREGEFLWNDSIISNSLTVFNSNVNSVSFSPNDGSCISTGEYSLFDLRLPTIIVQDTSVCSGETIELMAQVVGGEVFWPGFGEDSVLVVSEFGTYEVAARNECGTIFSEINVFEKECSCPVIIPNIFTPNSDGLNDLFKPELECVPQYYQFVILNRWGKEVFSTIDINMSWNGDNSGNDGNLASDGIYNYILRYSNPLRPLDPPKEIAGSVTLIR